MLPKVCFPAACTFPVQKLSKIVDANYTIKCKFPKKCSMKFCKCLLSPIVWGSFNIPYFQVVSYTFSKSKIKKPYVLSYQRHLELSFESIKLILGDLWRVFWNHLKYLSSRKHTKLLSIIRSMVFRSTTGKSYWSGSIRTQALEWV